MTIAPMTAQDMNAVAEIPAMPFMRPEDEELETLRSDICGVMYDMMGTAPLHSLYRFVANTRIAPARTEEGILRMVNAVTTTRMEAGECIYLEDDGPFNSFVYEMYSRVSRIGLRFVDGMDDDMDVEARICRFMDSLLNSFGLDGQDVLEIWCHNNDRKCPKTPKRQLAVIKAMVKGGFKPFMECIEFACLDKNESFGIF